MISYIRHLARIFIVAGLAVAVGCSSDSSDERSPTAIDIDVGDDVSSDNNPYEELCDALLKPAELEQICNGSEVGALAVGWEGQSTSPSYHDCGRRIVFSSPDDVYSLDIDLDDNETLNEYDRYRVVGHDDGLESVADGAAYNIDDDLHKRIITFTKGQFTGVVAIDSLEGGCTFDEHVEVARIVASKVPETWPIQ